MMVKWILALTLVGLSVLPVAAQTATPLSKLTWDQAAPDPATANGYTYTYYLDDVAVGTDLVGTVCTGTVGAPSVCSVPFPATTPGLHTLTLTARNAAGTSPPSTPPLAFTSIIAPVTPAHLRISQ